MSATWPEVAIVDLKSPRGKSVAIGPFGSRMKSDVYVRQGVPVVRGNNLGDHPGLIGDFVYVSEAFANDLTSCLIFPGDLVFPHRGAIGSVGLIRQLPNVERLIMSTSLMKLTCNEDWVLPEYLYYFFRSDIGRNRLLARSSNVGTPGIAQPLTSLQAIHVPLPPLPIQHKIVAILSAYDDLIETNNRRIRLLEEMARCIYREWFVNFRYPGHEPIQLEDSALGSIPQGWTIHTISEIASRERYAVTGGPFGSKLGTKDYRDRGVPVIRGTNLAVGGGFRDSDFVFVSDAKTDSMLSCLAHRGDILVTQRGTLGQVGLIPPSARFDRYLLSQSQMKITIDPEMGSGQYLYAALRSPEVTARLLGHAMTAGVPHINLSLLRNFEVIWPERTLQERFDRAVQPLGEQVENLTRSVENARATRSLLLPRLVSGAIDVTELDIEVPEAAA